MTRPDPALASLVGPILELHERLRDSVVGACESQAQDRLAAVAHDEEGDTQYAVDRVGEALLLDAFAEIAKTHPLVLIAEGLPAAGCILPEGTDPSDVRWRVIVDPIDGTRGLMYQKRSAWILTGVARDRGADTRLSDVELAVQTEIPLVKQHLSDQLWAVRGRGVQARRFNRIDGSYAPFRPVPSGATSIEHGFFTLCRFFPGARDVLAAVDDEIVHAVLGPPVPGKASCFEDQYASSGGQLYELMAGRDRCIADLRPLMRPVREARDLPMGLCCHPYDVCTALIARELGVLLTDPIGDPLDPPLDLETDVAWIGYANRRIREQVEPALRKALDARGLLPGSPAPLSPER